MQHISYSGLEKILREKGMRKTELSVALGLSSRTVAKIKKEEKLSYNTLLKISKFLNVPVNRLFRYESDNRILQLLRDEKETHLSGGLYA